MAFRHDHGRGWGRLRARRGTARGVGLTLTLLAISVAVPVRPVSITSALIGPGGACLLPDATPPVLGTPVVLGPCTGSADDNWTQNGDGTIVYQGRCLDVRAADPTPGTPVQLFTCNRTAAQRWTLSSTSLANSASGLCVLPDPPDPGQPSAQPGDPGGSPVRARMRPCNAPGTATSWQLGSAHLPVRASGSARHPVAPQISSVRWGRDFYDGFDGPLSSSWGRYGFGVQAVGHGGMGVYDIANVYTEGGHLVLRTRYADGAWTSAGVSAAPSFNAYQGRWEVRARFHRAVGLGYAFLLYPADGSWPPEIDLAEGHPNGPTVLATLHWAPGNQQIQKRTSEPDMTAWHTYGVIVDEQTITYTLDDAAWSHFRTAQTPKKKMWLGFQTAAISCPSTFECVPGNIPGPATPDSSTIDIDWVAHYSAE